MTPSSTPRTARSGRARRWFVVLAVLLLVLVLVTALAPTVLSGPGKGWVTEAFDESRAGSLEIESMSLGWFGEQTVENAVLRDPAGEVVATVESAVLPSLWALMTGGGDLGRVEVVLVADVEADEDGTNNLMRALAPQGAVPEPQPREPGPGESGPGEPEPREPAPPREAPQIPRDLRLDFELRVPRFTWSDPKLRAAGTSFELNDLVATLTVEPGEPLRFDARGQVAGGGELVAQASSRTAFDASPQVDLTANVQSLATTIVDAFAGSGGLLSDVLGPTLDLDLVAEGLSMESGTVVAELTSDLASARIAGRLEEGVVVSTEAGSEIAFQLTPESSERIVGNLVPLVANLTPSAPETRGRLVLSDFRLPLDGDIRRVDAAARLELGEVRYDILPSVAALLKKKETQSFEPEPFGLSVANGVVAYDGFTLPMKSTALVFDGSFDIATRALDLTTTIPFALLGQGAEDLLGEARGLLGDDVGVPLRITGTPTAPKIALGEGLDLREMLEQGVGEQLEDELQKGIEEGKKKLPGLLDDVLGRGAEDDEPELPKKKN